MAGESVTYQGVELLPIDPPESCREYWYGPETYRRVFSPTHAADPIQPSEGTTYLRDSSGAFHTIPGGWIDRVASPAPAAA